jgi:hypothetical protein
MEQPSCAFHLGEYNDFSAESEEHSGEFGPARKVQNTAPNHANSLGLPRKSSNINLMIPRKLPCSVHLPAHLALMDGVYLNPMEGFCYE